MKTYPDVQYVVSFSEPEPSPWAVELLDSIACVRVEDNLETDLVKIVVTEESDGEKMLVPAGKIESIEEI